MFYSVCKEKKDEELRYSKTMKACNSFYKGLYFISTTIIGYKVLKNEPYLTPYLLGQGDMSLFSTSYPFHVWPEYFQYYYLGTMGYHLHQTVAHLLQPHRNDFIEMFLHHVVTLLLYGFSYLCMFTAAGSSIMFLHDIADIFTSFVRCFTETTLVSILLVNAVGMTFSWAYTRLFVFPMMIYHS